MSTYKNNNVYICNLDQDIVKYNKQFKHSIIPNNFNLSVPINPTQTRYDSKIYPRFNSNINIPETVSLNCNLEPTKCTYYKNNIDTETTLHNSDIRNNHCKYNSYIPSIESDLYKLNIPYEKQKGVHDLLFRIPNFSSSCSVPDTETNPFLNFTREQRNKIN